MSKPMRYVHLFAAAAQLVATALFAWGWVVSGGTWWVVSMGWCLFYGALSTHALWKDWEARKGLRA